MPEGPEVRLMADRIEKAIAGHELTKVTIDSPKIMPLRGKLLANTLRKVHTYSKAFVLEFDEGIFIYVHLQLYGKWKIGTIGNKPQTNRKLRLWLETEKHYAALYSATEIQTLKKEQIREHSYIKKLGPDLLANPQFGVGHVSRRLGKKEFSRRSLGHLLLDQSFFSGVGNYLRSEILFEAGLLPSSQIGKINANQKTDLARAIHTMMHRSYDTKGVTVSKVLSRKARKNKQTRKEYRHYVFARQNKPCRICNENIEKITFAGRRLYFCSNCQSN